MQEFQLDDNEYAYLELGKLGECIYIPKLLPQKLVVQLSWESVAVNIGLSKN